MYEKSFLFAALLSFSCLAFAEVDLVPSEGAKPRQFIQMDIGISPARGLEHDKQFIGAKYDFDFTPFFGFAGIQSDTNLLDFVLRTEWAPFVFYSDKSEWRFGTTLGYHFQQCSDYYDEHSLIVETTVRWKTKNNFHLTSRFGYSCHFTQFPIIKNLVIYDNDILLMLEVNKMWSTGIELFGMLGSYNTFRYPLFFCPQLTIGTAYNFNQSFRLGFEIEWGLTDFLSSVMYVNYAMFKINARFSF